jgi:hypothetical protein
MRRSVLLGKCKVVGGCINKFETDPDSCEKNINFWMTPCASTKLELARDDNGGRILRRTYRFEFSETGNNRREGEVIMLGERVESVTLEPYEILE